MRTVLKLKTSGRRVLACLMDYCIVSAGVGASVPCLFTLGAELFPVHKRGVHLSYIARYRTM